MHRIAWINANDLSILDGFKEIKVATSYVSEDGIETDTFPADLRTLEDVPGKSHLKAKYETLPGWNSETTGCRKWEDLPEQARKYVEFIEKKINVPVTWIGTGPKREDMVRR